MMLLMQVIYLNTFYMQMTQLYIVLLCTSTLDSLNMQLANFNNIDVELQKISEWLEVNKLSLNANKSKYMIFHHLQKEIPRLQLKINDTPIECVDNFNFLGLTINKHLN